MRGSIHLGKIAGIRIDVNVSWFLIFVFLTASLALSWFPQTAPHLATVAYWTAGAVTTILFFVSVLLHELAHSLVARIRGLPVKSITLFVLGGVSNIEREPQSPGVEFQMAFVGPLTSVILGGVLWLAATSISSQYLLVANVVEYLALANIVLGLFNLIPGFPMDGGRVLRSIIWKATGNLDKATRWAATVGQGIAYLFFAAGALAFFGGYYLDGMWIALIGWFLLETSRAERTSVSLQAAFRDTQVRDVMGPAPAGVEANTSIQQLVYEHFLRTGSLVVPIVQTGYLVGFVTPADVLRVPRGEWSLIPAGQVMTPLGRFQVALPLESVNQAIERMSSARAGILPVVEDGRLAGVVSLEAIQRIMEMRRLLGITDVQRSSPQHADVR